MGFIRNRNRSIAAGFSLLEILMAIVVLGILVSIGMGAYGKARHVALRATCVGNLRSYVISDLAYKNEHGTFPKIETLIPSSMSYERMRIIAESCGMALPPGEMRNWPKRPELPGWMSCPCARHSGYAEGMTIGGIYNGYIYVGGIEESDMVARGMARVVNAGHSANLRGENRGVLWADILTEFNSGGARRFEVFHVDTKKRYNDFRFHAYEIDGIHRGWSDGQIEWLPREQLKLDGSEGSNLQIRHFMGNFYY